MDGRNRCSPSSSCREEEEKLSRHRLLNIDNESTSFDREFHFRQQSSWLKGLNPWSSTEQHLLARSELPFDEDLRFCCPKRSVVVVNEREKDKCPPFDGSSFVDRSLPIRLQEMIEEQKIFYLRHDFVRPPSPSFPSLLPSPDDDVLPHPSPRRRSRSGPKIRHPLRSIRSDYSSTFDLDRSLSLSTSLSMSGTEEKEKELQRENYSSLLREQLTSLIPYSRRSSQQFRHYLFHARPKTNNWFDEEKSSSPFDSKLILQRYEKLQQLLIRPPSSSSSTHLYRNSTMKSSVHETNAWRDVRLLGGESDLPVVREKTLDLSFNSSADETTSNWSLTSRRSSWKRPTVIQKRSSTIKHRENFSLNDSFPVIVAGKRLPITSK